MNNSQYLHGILLRLTWQSQIFSSARSGLVGGLRFVAGIFIVCQKQGRNMLYPHGKERAANVSVV